ncbi:MAG: Heme-binding protein A [Gammaproteobacteria bacterium]|nr:Heme-binding protein A [Gammaproteobacteria bacterium]
MKFMSVLLGTLAGAVMVCSSNAFGAWNNPYPESEAEANIIYSSFSERPKHLDPVRSYSSDEYTFIAQIYEPPLQYHFLKRPYKLVPLTVRSMPSVTYYNAQGNVLSASAPIDDIAFSEYEFQIEPGIRYQPHPALAVNEAGEYIYHDLTRRDIEDIHTVGEFEETGTRELTAKDYVYEIKRMADPRRHCPIAGVMAQYIVGFAEMTKKLKQRRQSADDVFIDLRNVDMEGLEVVDRYAWRIRIRGKYPQFLYWQAMPFFAPMPWEADLFYAQPGMEEKNMTLDWYPIGTGPYMLKENNPNLRMVLERNSNFHGEKYPVEGEPGDRTSGLLDDAGKPLPFADEVFFSREKEAIPSWNKFLQGYYDSSGISSDSFDQAIRFNTEGEAGLTDEMRDRGIKLSTAVQTSTIYIGFNMLDETLGADSERGRKLRRAISIAVDIEEYISIFANGRAMAAQGPVPPGIFGDRTGKAGSNPYVYDWVDGEPKRKPLSAAKELLRGAGYGDGIDRSTGQPLALNFEAISRGPDDKARFKWLRKQFDKLGIQLIVRATDYNRFREKMIKGTGQIYMWGWNADYPDPENFMFLLYGPNSKAEHNGENTSNYNNPEFDLLFEQMKNMENDPERQRIIDEMIEIVRRDAPWIWGFHPKSFALYHAWYKNVKPNLMANNTFKYKRVDTERRARLREKWNQPVVWPIFLIVLIVVATIVPAVYFYRRHERSTAR